MTPSRHVRMLLISALIVTNIVVFTLAVYSLYHSRRQYELRANTLTQNIASAVDQNVSNSIEKIDLALHTVAGELERQLAAQGIDEQATDAFLARHAQRLPEIVAFRAANADGVLILGKDKRVGGVSWANRDYFIYHRDHPGDRVQLSKPFVGSISNQYVIGFTRRYNYPDGRFAGVIIAPITVEHFTRLLSNFDLGANGTISLRQADHGLISRVPAMPGHAAGKIGNKTLSPEMHQLLGANVATATFHTPVSSDGFERTATFHRLQNAPMFVTAGVASKDYLEGWTTEVYQTSTLTFGFMLMSLVSAGFLLRLLAEAEIHEQQLSQSEEEMELALAGADLGSWDLDLTSGRYTHNPRLVGMLGYAPDELEVNNDTLLALLDPGDLPGLSSPFYAHLKGETPAFEAEFRIRHQDDHWVWILVRGKVVARDADGRALRITGTTLDISARKQGEVTLRARETRLSALIASMQDVVFVLDTEGRIVEYFQPPRAHCPSYRSREQILGKTPDEFLPADVAELFDDAIVGIMTDGLPKTFEYSLPTEGNTFIFQATTSPLLDESRYPTGFLTVVRDITDERGAQQALKHLARSHALLLESVGDGIYGTDAALQTTFVNAAALSMLGFSEVELLGDASHELIHHHRQDGTPYAAETCPIHLTMQDGQIRHEENEWFWRKDGSGFPVAMTVTPAIENGERVGVVVVFQDISERKVHEERIRNMAFYDPLTHLPNRRLLVDRLSLALPASLRHDSYGAILFLDLDDFKLINDTRGHDFGDMLLTEAAQRLLDCVRVEDTVARLGGDEFVVMLEDLSPLAAQAALQAEAIAEKIRCALGKAYSFQGESHRCTCSIGIVLFKGDEVPTSDLLKRADTAMYQAKSSGRDSFRTFTLDAELPE